MIDAEELVNLELSREELYMVVGDVERVAKQTKEEDQVRLTEQLVEEAVGVQFSVALWGLVDAMQRQSQKDGDSFQGRAWEYCADHIARGLEATGVDKWRTSG